MQNFNKTNLIPALLCAFLFGCWCAQCVQSTSRKVELGEGRIQQILYAGDDTSECILSLAEFVECFLEMKAQPDQRSTLEGQKITLLRKQDFNPVDEKFLAFNLARLLMLETGLLHKSEAEIRSYFFHKPNFTYAGGWAVGFLALSALFLFGGIPKTQTLHVRKTLLDFNLGTFAFAAALYGATLLYIFKPYLDDPLVIGLTIEVGAAFIIGISKFWGGALRQIIQWLIL